VSVLGVIPARYGSVRFPGKPLADIAGMSLIERVWRQCNASGQLAGLVVATDDKRIKSHVEGFGGRALITSPDHQSGTDRLGEVARKLPHDHYVNIQGDEPLLPPDAVDALIERTLAAGAEMSTMVSPLGRERAGEAADPNVVKVVRAGDGYALLFSRARIPYDRDGEPRGWLKHIGIYMYSHETLMQLCGLERTPLERRESLEQLRALESGIRIYCVEHEYEVVGIDVPEDVETVVRLLGEQRRG
jgi:3-deoxy-manno-octulosonate cytidylyltransferase (CMP-KDO synthetase)